MRESSDEREQLYRLLVEHSSDLISLFDFEGNRVFASPSYERVLGYAPDAPGAGVHPDDRERALAAWRRFRDGDSAPVTYRCAHRDGNYRWLEVSGRVVEHRGMPHVLAVSRDITEQRLAEEQRNALEQRLRAFVDNASDSMFLFDTDARVLDANARACESLGYSREELIGRLPTEFSESPPERIAELARRLATEHEATLETRHRRKDGSTFPVEIRLRAFRDGGHGYGIALVRDLSDRERAARELEDSHKLLNIVIENTSDSVFVKDVNGRYLLVNPAAQKLVARTAEQLLGRTADEIWSEPIASTIAARDRKAYEAGSFTFEETFVYDGQQRTYVGTENVYRDADGKPLGLVGILRDVTALKQLEEQFRQAQKMEAIGRLAGGIAHDFNNLLMVINTYAAMVLSSLSEDDPDREMLVEISKAGERAAMLTRQLLAFSRKQVLQAQVLDLDSVVRDLAKLLERLIGETITLAVETDPDLGRVRVDPGLFQQALTNLVVNARDAMPRGGTITIEVRNVEITANHPRGFAPGEYVVVGVRDNGNGMAPDVRERVFEPFFTTKEPGQGTGLGLAMVYGFVAQSGGFIEVDSSPGVGTWFRIYLPTVTAPAARLRVEQPDPPGGTETVLLVEDEETVRRVTRRALQALGYTVLEASDGESAREIARAHTGHIHVLLSDIVMPNMTGPEVAAQITEMRSDVRVIFMSGYAANRNDIPAGAGFLQKPFRVEDLARKLREVLDRA